jgi:hypothetical protein
MLTLLQFEVNSNMLLTSKAVYKVIFRSDTLETVVASVMPMFWFYPIVGIYSTDVAGQLLLVPIEREGLLSQKKR